MVNQNFFEKCTWKWHRSSSHHNNVEFLLIDITSEKVRRNNADFSPIEITSKKYVENTWKFIEIFFLTYPRNIDIESTSIQRIVSVVVIGNLLSIWFGAHLVSPRLVWFCLLNLRIFLTVSWILFGFSISFSLLDIFLKSLFISIKPLIITFTNSLFLSVFSVLLQLSIAIL